MSIFTGCAVAIVTPFLSDGSVDYERFSSLINWQIEEGIDAIVVCGTTGEASTLSDDEIIEVIDFVIKKVNGRVPVIAGAGSNDTKHCIEKMQKIQSL
ncbi:MAG TPA: 4-hydroxy-tetrahydrodipicolinate synthase, partial [Clostridiales bacterium]|nr:4-hydroxy-tetrahydrodipicolinate synthase [Clostridiales bacterium]